MASRGHLRQIAALLVAQKIEELLQDSPAAALGLSPDDEDELTEILKGQRDEQHRAAKQLSGLTMPEIAERIR